MGKEQSSALHLLALILNVTLVLKISKDSHHNFNKFKPKEAEGYWKSEQLHKTLGLEISMHLNSFHYCRRAQSTYKREEKSRSYFTLRDLY